MHVPAAVEAFCSNDPVVFLVEGLVAVGAVVSRLVAGRLRDRVGGSFQPVDQVRGVEVSRTEAHSGVVAFLPLTVCLPFDWRQPAREGVYEGCAGRFCGSCDGDGGSHLVSCLWCGFGFGLGLVCEVVEVEHVAEVRALWVVCVFAEQVLRGVEPRPVLAVLLFNLV